MKVGNVPFCDLLRTFVDDRLSPTDQFLTGFFRKFPHEEFQSRVGHLFKVVLGSL